MRQIFRSTMTFFPRKQEEQTYNVHCDDQAACVLGSGQTNSGSPLFGKDNVPSGERQHSFRFSREGPLDSSFLLFVDGQD